MGRGRGRGRGDGGGRFNDRGPGGGRGRGFNEGGDYDDSTTYGVPSDKCGLVIGKGMGCHHYLQSFQYSTLLCY